MAKISYRQKIALGMLGLAVVAALWYTFFYQAQKVNIAHAKAEIEKLQTQVSDANFSVTDLYATELVVEKMELEIDSLLTIIPSKERISYMTNSILVLGDSSSLVIGKIQPDLGALLQSDEYIVKVPVDIQASGTYLQFGHFVESLDQLPFRLYIGNVTMENAQDPGKLHIRLDSHVYVINTKAST